MRDLWPLAVAAHALAAGAGVALWRHVREHAPVAFALVLMFAVGLAQKAREAWIVPAARKLLTDPPPYEGWQRVAFHVVEQAGELLTPAMVVWVALVALAKKNGGPEGEPGAAVGAANGPAIGRSKDAHSVARWTEEIFFRGAAVAWLLLSATCAALYPALRGDALVRFYLGAHVAALLVALAAVVARLRRGHLRELTATEWCALMIVAFVGADLCVGAWRYGLYGDAYRATQGGLLALYPFLAAAQLVAWVKTRPA